ncbi:MAG: hypothetical protein GY869_04490 [Planctomycetes bacterium]|nr:hypothetical protein [Planctomycetota bacterium]
MSQPKSKKENPQKPPRYLPRWIIFVVIFALLILSLFVHKAYQRRRLNDKLQSYRDAGQPADAYDLENWLPTPPDDQNATLQILNAASRFTSWSEKPIPNDPNLAQMYPLLILHGLELSDNPPPDWNQKNLNLLPVVGNSLNPEPGESMGPHHSRLIADFLADNADANQQLHLALQLDQFKYLVDYSQGIEMVMPNLNDFRMAAKRLQLQTLLHLENNRSDLAAQSVTDSFRLARALCSEPILITYLVGVACGPLAINNLEYTLCRYPLNHDQLNNITSALTDLQSAPGLSLALIGERTLASHTLYNNSQGILMGNSGAKSFFVALLLNTFGLVDMNHLVYLDFMDRYISVLNLPFDQRSNAAQDLETDIQNLSGIHFVAKITMPAFSRVFEIDLRHHAQLQTARTALAIEHYRLDHDNQLPITLNDLIPDYCQSVPLDPFDGLPIKYLKIDSGYLIYSVGLDLTDDGGILTNIDGEKFTTGTDITLTIKRK